MLQRVEQRASTTTNTTKNPNIGIFLHAAQANQRSFDMTWQEVQNALVAALRITGFWYILLGEKKKRKIKISR